MTGPLDPIFGGGGGVGAGGAAGGGAAAGGGGGGGGGSGADTAVLKTYRYLRLGMLAAVAALAYSIVKEYRQPGAHCFLGSISGYYYTPVHPVFIGVMVSIALALIAIKGRNGVEDLFLSIAGMLAPIVAFIPTTDDLAGVCRPAMLQIGHYEPAKPGSLFVPASTNNNLHALVFAGYFAIGLLLLITFTRHPAPGAPSHGFTKGTWINLGVGFAILLTVSSLLHWDYTWVLQGHAWAAVSMFGFLAVAALADCFDAYTNAHTIYAVLYGVIGALMIISGLLFIWKHGSAGHGSHIVLTIEATEITLFAAFWLVQTWERWFDTV